MSASETVPILFPLLNANPPNPKTRMMMKTKMKKKKRLFRVELPHPVLPMEPQQHPVKEVVPQHPEVEVVPAQLKLNRSFLKRLNKKMRVRKMLMDLIAMMRIQEFRRM